MLDLFLTICYILIGFSAVAYADLKEAKYVNTVSKLYILLSIIYFYHIFNEYLYKPIKNESTTTAIVTGSYVRSSKFWGRKCSYIVHGKEYQGYLSRCRWYLPGDSITVIYDSLNPQHMLPAYELYWYINPDKKKYWDEYLAKESTYNPELDDI